MFNLLLLIIVLLSIGLPLTYTFNRDSTLGSWSRSSDAITLGVISVILVGRVLVSNNLAFSYLIPALFLCSISYALSVKSDLFLALRNVAPVALIISIIVTLSGYLVGRPLLGEALLGLPIRLGPDGLLYATMADHLREGGTLASVPDPASNRIDLLVAGFSVHLRWGYSIFLTFVCKLLSPNHPYDIMYLPGWLLCSLPAVQIYGYLRESLKLPLLLSSISALCVSLNVLALSLVFENQQPNALLIPLFISMTLMLIRFRSHKSSSPRELLKRSLVLALHWATILVTYSEIIPVLITYFSIASFCSYILWPKKGANPREYVYLHIIGILVSVLLIGSLSTELFTHLTTLKVSGSTVGYPLPQWPLLNDLIGIGNIFHGFDRSFSALGEPITYARNFSDWSFRLILNLMIAFILFTGLLDLIKKGNQLGAFLLPVPGFFLIFSLRALFLNDHNYLYIKIAVIFAPYIILWFSYSGYSCWRSIEESVLRKYLKQIWTKSTGFALAIAWLLLIFFHERDYAREYRLTSDVVSSQSLGMSETDRAKSILLPSARGCGNLKFRMIDRTREGYFFSFKNTYAIDQWTACSTADREALARFKDRVILAEVRRRGEKGPSNWTKPDLSLSELLALPPGKCEERLASLVKCP